MKSEAHSLEQASALNDLPSCGYLRLKSLQKIVPFSPATFWRKVKTGEFPKPYKLSCRITAWRVEDVRQWLVQQELGR